MLTRAYLKSLATSTSFERGEDYYDEGAVGRIKRDGNKFKARVEGTDTYKTKLTLRPAGAELRCNCPYDYGGICKHAVALGLAVLEEYGPNLRATAEPTTKDSAEALEDALEDTHPDAQLEFLAGLLRQNDDLRQQFLRFVGADEEAAPTTAPATVPPAEISSENVATEVYEALSDLEFNDELLRGYTNYYGDYLYDEGDGMLELADAAIKEVLAPHAQLVAEAVHGGQLHAALRYWVGVYEGSRDAEPQADEYDLFSYEGYSERVLDGWWTLLDEAGASRQLADATFAPAETEAALTLLFGRYPAGVPDHFEPLLQSLARGTAAAAYLRPLLEAAPPTTALEPVLLRVAETLTDDTLWLRVAEQQAPQNAPVALQLLDYYRQHDDRANLLRLLRALWGKFGHTLTDYVFSHVTPAEARDLYLAALERRCRSQQSLADYRELCTYWTAGQRRQFVDEQVKLGEGYGASGVFAAELLAAENRGAELLPYLLRRTWVGQASTAAILTLAAQTHPDECMDAVMERVEKLLNDTTNGRGRDVYQQVAAWLTALDAFASLHSQVVLFAAHLYADHSRLSALREELRKAQLVKTLKMGNKHELLAPTPEADLERAKQQSTGHPKKRR